MSIKPHIQRLYQTVADLEQMYPGRPFTVDGHLLGSIGEVMVAELFGLNLMPPSNKGFDALDKEYRKIEIKITQGKLVGFRRKPPFAIVVTIDKQANIQIVYNGPGLPIWKHFKDKKKPANGQYTIGLKTLEKLNRKVKEKDRIR